MKKIKICGIKNQENLNAISALELDWIGLNFYEKSRRFVEKNLQTNKVQQPLVGVFVNENIENVIATYKQYNLSFLQLHGGESVAYCRSAQEYCPVIKVFSVDAEFNFEETNSFDFCEYFLFDTKCEDFGGSGQKFDWNKLKEYSGNVPFLLAGGIGPDDIKSIESIQHEKLFGIDINSKFEIAAGIKDVSKVDNFIQKLKK